jgi:hypothetical protein
MFDYPPEIEARTGLSGLTLPRRDLFHTLARDLEATDPKRAAFFRDVASCYPDCDPHGHEVDRDRRGNILVDYDDWDELSEEQQRLRGNRGAATALLDRLRFHVEMMDDDVELKDEVDAIRRALNDLVEPLSMV